MERWKQIKNSPDYEVSDKGRVRSWKPWRGYKTPRILKPAENKGYQQVVVITNGKRTYRYVHHLVLDAFAGKRRPGQECCHGNADKSDNRLSNLRWDTHPNNMADHVKAGSHVGAMPPSTKLSNEEAEEIRALIREGKTTQTRIAEMYNVGNSTISRIKLNQAWK